MEKEPGLFGSGFVLPKEYEVGKKNSSYQEGQYSKDNV